MRQRDAVATAGGSPALRNSGATSFMTHSILDFLRNAVVQYGYWAVAVALLLENAGIPVPGETILLLASFAAFSQHEIQLSWLIIVGTIAATVGDNFGYAVGYYGGRSLLERYQSLFRIQTATIERGEKLFERYGSATVLVARFIFGMRIIAGPMAGVLRMPWRRFAIFNFLGAALWVSVISAAGYFFGQHWQKLESGLKRFDIAVAVAVVVVAALIWWRSRRKSSASAK